VLLIAFTVYLPEPVSATARYGLDLRITTRSCGKAKPGMMSMISKYLDQQEKT